MAMAHRNIIAGLALIALGAWYAFLIGSLPERSVMPNTPGPSFFPTIIVSITLLLSALLVISGVMELGKPGDGTDIPRSGVNAKIAVGAFIVYLGMLPYAGFILASVPFFAVLMHLYGSRSRFMIAVSSLIVPIALFTIFRYGFQIILPRGILAF